MATVFRPPLVTSLVYRVVQQPFQTPNLLTTTLFSIVNPFIPDDFPNPLRRPFPRDLLGFLSESRIHLFGKDKFFGDAGQVPDYDWSNPVRRKVTPQDTTVNNLLLTTLAVPVGESEQTLPTRRKLYTADTSVLNLLETTLAVPVGETEQSLPARSKPYRANDVVPNLLLTTLAQPTPLVPNDFPNPLRRPFPRDLLGFLSESRIHLFGQDQFFGEAGQGPSYNWPNPVRRKIYIPDTSVLNLLGTTLAVPVGQGEQTLPTRLKNRVTTDIAPNLLSTLLAPTPFIPVEIPNPVTRKAKPLDTNVPNLLETTLAVPVGQAEYSVPVQAKKSLLAEQPANLLLTTLAIPPFLPVDCPNPVTRKQFPVQNETQNLLLTTLAVPVGQSEQRIPSYPHVKAFDWLAPNLLTSTLVSAPPVTTIEWPNPYHRKDRAIVFDAPNLLLTTLRPTVNCVAILFGNKRQRSVGGEPHQRTVVADTNKQRTVRGEPNQRTIR